MTKSRNEWTITPVQAPAGLRLPRLISWWERTRASGTLPNRQHFDLADWKKDLPWVGIIDLLTDESGTLKDGIFRVWGTQLVYHFGGEPTGKALGEYGERYLERWSEISARCFESGRPCIATGKIIVPDFDFLAFEVVLLPLFDAQGRVSQFLTAVELLPRSDV